MPTMAIACAISRLPRHRGSRCCDSIDFYTRTTFGPIHGKHAETSHCADDCQGKEESEDYMRHHQQPIDAGNAESENDLVPVPRWRCSRVGHHVERVEDESNTSHRYQTGAKGSVKEQTPQRSLCDKAAEPRGN